MSEHYVCITLDFDAVSLWIGMGQTSPTPISRGEFGAVAVPRLLELFASLEIETTWYIPGLTIDTYEDVCRNIAAAGHEIGHHGYDHISPRGLSYEEEKYQLVRGIECIERVSGIRPRGYRSPAWDLSPHSIELLLGEGFLYDSSMMGHDYLPYRARQGDVVEQGRPPQFGEESKLWELPISWSADDFPHFEYFKGGGLADAEGVFANWIQDFEYLVENLDRGVMTYTLHPFVIGRGHRMRMLERLLIALRQRGAVFLKAEDVIQKWAQR
ncbi:MAG: polysaccharide deacetylase [Pseudomonadota bacterium]|nr:polysaccharide deacetylase [Pseudomonadota bacterium]